MADIPFWVPFNNRPLKTPSTIRVRCIGAGFAGLTLAYKISHALKVEDVIDFGIYERQVTLLLRALASTPERTYTTRNRTEALGSRTDIRV
jgi:hypothetical protein